MGDGRRRDTGADDESRTDLEEVRPELIESVPIRHGMVLAGRYAVEKIIGRGGSGVVVRAHDRDLRQEVAIKIVRVELAGQRMWAGRLAREVKLARQIHHPNVCRVFDFEQADGRAFLVMELAANGTLRDELRSGALGARPLAARIADARAVASALAAIHAAGIVHRDLTPQNLLRMADGRLVVSDFGLATDASESTSVHGGTVAYMAPEVLRGGKSSFASDIWALGVVMHELVFGVKPRWSDAASPEMLAPSIGRRLTEEERAVLEACRACTAKDPSRRIARADEAGRLLTRRRRWWMRSRVGLRRPMVSVAALAIAAVGVAVFVRTQRKPIGRQASAQAQDVPSIVPTGEAADWTDVSAVIAEVPDRIQCTRLLPDQHTIRLVWGTPPRAEDIDVVTRRRVPSQVVPDAYAEGCPDLSPDNKRLVYQGHTKDGRAFAFLSQHPDGSDAVAVVPTAEPSMLSEPTWLGDNDDFSFDVDPKHMGVFSTSTRRMRVLPEATSEPVVTAFRYVSSTRLYVATVLETGDTQVSEIEMPEMQVVPKFRAPPVVLDLGSLGTFVYFAHGVPGKGGAMVEVDLARHEVRRLGGLRNQWIRHPTLVPAGLAFVGVNVATSVVAVRPNGVTYKWKSDGAVLSAAVCGEDIAVAREKDATMSIARFSSDGRFLASLTNGPWDSDPTCSRDGKLLFYLRQRSRPGITRCDSVGCRSIVEHEGMSLAASPAGDRLAFVTGDDKRGLIVEIVDARSGQRRKLVETETGCRPGWSSNETVWVSRRKGATIVWVEVNADSGAETGRSVPGSRDCTDSKPDPLSPAQPDVRVVYEHRSQLRLLPREHLPRHLWRTLGNPDETR